MTKRMKQLLLCLADGEHSAVDRFGGRHGRTLRALERRGLADGLALTDPGKAEAERLRPRPWAVQGDDLPYNLIGSDGVESAFFGDRALARRVARLLTADDLARAKGLKP